MGSRVGFLLEGLFAELLLHLATLTTGAYVFPPSPAVLDSWARGVVGSCVRAVFAYCCGTDIVRLASPSGGRKHRVVLSSTVCRSQAVEVLTNIQLVLQGMVWRSQAVLGFGESSILLRSHSRGFRRQC